MPLTTDPGPDDPIEPEQWHIMLDHALGAPWYRLSFPVVLERRFDHDRWPARVRHVWRIGLLGLAVFMAFLVSDARMIPDIFKLAVVARLLFVAAAMPALILIISRPVPYWVAEVICPIYTVACVAIVVGLFILTHSPDKVSYLNGIGLVLLYGNLCLQARFRYVVVSSLLSLLVVAAGLRDSTISPIAVQSTFLVVVSTIVLTLVTAYRLERQERRDYLHVCQEARRSEQLLATNAALRDMAERDGLTGLVNRRALDRRLEDAWRRCAAERRLLGLAMLDVDCFKNFNDRYGHQAGDDCLREVAAAIYEQLREEHDIVGRYGGEEFLVILPGLAPAKCQQVADRIVAAIEALAIPHAASLAASVVTASIGVACIQPSSAGSTADLVKAADAALYVAKREGRNRCQLLGSLTP
jgi:diguanylate cyclase (GGDEF)-like protein